MPWAGNHIGPLGDETPNRTFRLQLRARSPVGDLLVSGRRHGRSDLVIGPADLRATPFLGNGSPLLFACRVSKDQVSVLTLRRGDAGTSRDPPYACTENHSKTGFASISTLGASQKLSSNPPRSKSGRGLDYHRPEPEFQTFTRHLQKSILPGPRPPNQLGGLCAAVEYEKNAKGIADNTPTSAGYYK